MDVDWNITVTTKSALKRKQPWKTKPNKAVLEPRVSPAFAITYLCNQCYTRFDPIPVKVRKRSLTPRWLLTPRLLRSHVWLYPRIIVSKSHENTSKYVDTVTLFAKLEPKVIDPKMTFDPTSVEVTCVTLPKDHCVQVPWKYIKVCGYSDPFCKNLNQRTLTPRWPLTPYLLRSHVWLYSRIIVSKPHGNTIMYVDIVINFANYHIHTTLFCT